MKGNRKAVLVSSNLMVAGWIGLNLVMDCYFLNFSCHVIIENECEVKAHEIERRDE